jgi:hypothetical protein
VGIIDILEISKLVNVLGVVAKISCVGMLWWPKLRNLAGDLSPSRVLWCASLSHHYFCARFPPLLKKIRFLFLLVEMILLISTVILQEEFSIESNLTKIYFPWGVNLATCIIMTCHQSKAHANISGARL